jgi:nitrogen fixation protein FixH
MSMTREAKSGWRWFPFASIGALFFVVVVNFGMIYAALHTFPGEYTTANFDTSNRYDQVLDLAARQAALGWTVDASAQSHSPVLRLTGRDGTPLHNAMVSGTALRPLGPRNETQLSFTEGEDGLFHAGTVLNEPGQWDLRLQVAVGGESEAVTRRILVK